jgi:5'-methylthioadenosine phosphorylase
MATGEINPIGIIGGSGLYDIPEIEITSRVRIDTPFGEPSDEYVVGSLRGIEVIFLGRHGPGHRITAPGVNYRANVFGFKSLGVETVIAVSAVGSLREELAPLDIAIPDQIIDLTHDREATFFTDNPTIHVTMADPTCATLNKVLFEAADQAGINVQLGGTYVCMEGPAFSTRAESRLYRSWDVDVIGMTAATEAKLCREAEICYSSLSLVTDYDVWHENADDVTLDMIIEYVQKNAEAAKKILKEAILHVPDLSACACRNALADAIATDPDAVPDVTRNRLRVLLSKYLPPRD